jgi:WD40 repeat protein
MKNLNHHSKLALINNGSNLIVTAFDSSKETEVFLHILDLNGNLIRSINVSSIIKQPSGICVRLKTNGDKEIFVGDLFGNWNNATRISILDSKFNFIKNIGYDLKSVRNLTIDSECDALYNAEGDNFISVWNVNNCQLIKKIPLKNSGVFSRIFGPNIYYPCAKNT